MDNTAATEGLRRKFDAVKDRLDQPGKRRWAAAEARELGHGGIARVARATGLARGTVAAGLRELAGEVPPLPLGKKRRPGAGRKKLGAHDPGLDAALQGLLEAHTRGDPEAPLRWTNLSTKTLAAELTKQQHPVSATTVRFMLKALGYSLQSHRQSREGADHPDRDAQFQRLNAAVRVAQAAGQPAVSIDTKKKETLGNLKNPGQVWRPQGQPVAVKVHDFADPELGKAIPYGVYDLAHDRGWVTVGVDHDTAEFAANTLLRWWRAEGRKRFPHATELTITADGGGSNAARSRRWKVERQRVANAAGLTLRMHHFPPGTSKWNKIEHRLFSLISSNWRGRPLLDRATVVSLIGATRTGRGAPVRVELDERRYALGRTASDAELAAVNLTPDAFRGEWNYVIAPTPK